MSVSKLAKKTDYLNAVFLDKVIKNLPGFVMVVKRDSTIVYTNKKNPAAFFDLVKDREELCGSGSICTKTFLNCDKIGNKDECCCQLKAAIYATIDEGKPTHDLIITREKIENKKLNKFYFKLNFEPIVIEDETYSLITVEDVTASELIRIDLIEKRSQVEKLNGIYQDELKIAKKLQMGIIPQKSFSAKGYTIDYRYYPLSDLCGDMFDYFSIGDDSIGVMIVDVMGHGTAPALVTTLIKGLIQGAGHKLVSSPSKLVRYLNRQVIKIFEDSYLTMVYGVINSKENTFTFVRAGHPKPWLINDSAAFEVGLVDNLMLGVDDKETYQEEVIYLSEGERLILYTDGLIDTENKNSGYEREIVKLIIANAENSNESLMKKLEENLVLRLKDGHHSDDICVLSIEKNRNFR